MADVVRVILVAIASVVVWFHWYEPFQIGRSVQFMNLTNKVALYNFLSTFSGTHFLEPRSVTARSGYTF